MVDFVSLNNYLVNDIIKTYKKPLNQRNFKKFQAIDFYKIWHDQRFTMQTIKPIVF